jgi:2-isopropylmalate synthase
LENLGVDVIEAGFPAASDSEKVAVREISRTVTRCEVAALCRAVEDEIRIAWDAIKMATNPLLHVFFPVSDLHLSAKLRITRSEALQAIAQALDLCHSLCPRVEFSAEDATRADQAFLKKVISLALEHGASVINIADTVGVATPDAFARMIGDVMELCRGSSTIVSVHCHNDLGLALANALAAIVAGAQQVDCCVNGMGDRAGIVALEELVMVLRMHQDIYRANTGISSDQLLRISQCVSKAIGIPVPCNKAIVGANVFSHKAGIHQHGVLSEPSTYEVMPPKTVGFQGNRLVLGKHSGRHALKKRLNDLGYTVNASTLDHLFTRLKSMADCKREITDEDIRILAVEESL